MQNWVGNRKSKLTLFRKQYKELSKVHGLNRTLNKEKTSELRSSL